jgi:hypothetical protein
MIPQFVRGNVRANCSSCGGAVTTFEYQFGNGGEYGSVVLPFQHQYTNQPCGAIVYKLLRCAGCGRGAIAEVHIRSAGDVNYYAGLLECFYPRTIERLALPRNVPEGIAKEFTEAEVCASAQAWRAGSALLRSTLEKALRMNGYTEGSLAGRIDVAAADGVITAARARRAHDEIRVLGNDVLHDEWRVVTEEEFELAHHYAQRILEDLYDDRPSVEGILVAKKRLPAP